MAGLGTRASASVMAAAAAKRAKNRIIEVVGLEFSFGEGGGDSEQRWTGLWVSRDFVRIYHN